MTIETVIAWLVENPEWREALMILWTFSVAATGVYIINVVALTTSNWGKPWDSWAWERGIVRKVCAWPLWPVLLATWPLRALWRWWKEKREAARLVANLHAALPLKLGDGYAALKLAKEYIATHKPIPTVFADAKGYADSANAPDRVGREEFQELVAMHGRMREREIERERDVDSRLAALEAKEARPEWQPARAQAKLYAHFTASGFAKMSSNNNLEVLGPQDFTATPPASEPEVRVWKSIYNRYYLCEGDKCWIYATGRGDNRNELFWEGSVNTPESLAWATASVTELHGPEKDAIAAEWRAWKREI